MKNLDDTTREIVEKAISNARLLKTSLAEDSLKQINEVLGTIEDQISVYSLLLSGSTPGTINYEYYKRAVSYYKEQKFLINWIEKGFKGIESSTSKYVADLETDILGVKE
jgi:hypothetical protein